MRIEYHNYQDAQILIVELAAAYRELQSKNEELVKENKSLKKKFKDILGLQTQKDITRESIKVEIKKLEEKLSRL